MIERLLAMDAGLEQRLFHAPGIEGGQRDKLRETSEALMEGKLWIDDTVNLSTTQLRDRAEILVKRRGVRLVIVDYVHLMLSNINHKRYENRVQEVGEISRSLKALARELNVPVLAIAPLSRAFESRPAKRPDSPICAMGRWRTMPTSFSSSQSLELKRQWLQPHGLR